MSEKDLNIKRFEGKNIRNIYPCGEIRVGVPYASKYYLEYPEVVSTGKTRDVKGPAAEKIAENVAKFDKKTGVLSRIRAMRSK